MSTEAAGGGTVTTPVVEIPSEDKLILVPVETLSLPSSLHIYPCTK